MSLASGPDSGGSNTSATVTRKGAGLAATVGVVGVLLTGAIVGGMLVSGGQSPRAVAGTERITTVDPADLGAAANTLTVANQAALMADAKSCRAPLAVMTLTKTAGTTGGMIRIRSGSYLSPAFSVTDSPQRIAIPFPAPYAAGHGILSVEGAATGVELTLYPTWSAPNLDGAGIINLVWDTNKPCGK